eukprot:1489699-Rhodomonas_salina.1
MRQSSDTFLHASAAGCLSECCIRNPAVKSQIATAGGMLALLQVPASAVSLLHAAFLPGRLCCALNRFLLLLDAGRRRRGVVLRSVRCLALLLLLLHTEGRVGAGRAGVRERGHGVAEAGRLRALQPRCQPPRQQAPRRQAPPHPRDGQPPQENTGPAHRKFLKKSGGGSA